MFDLESYISRLDREDRNMLLFVLLFEGNFSQASKFLNIPRVSCAALAEYTKGKIVIYIKDEKKVELKAEGKMNEFVLALKSCEDLYKNIILTFIIANFNKSKAAEILGLNRIKFTFLLSLAIEKLKWLLYKIYKDENVINSKKHLEVLENYFVGNLVEKFNIDFSLTINQYLEKNIL